MDHVQDFLKTYDLTKQPYSLTSPKMQYFNYDAQVVKTQDMELKLTSWDLLYYRLRANFDGVKSEYCPVPDNLPGDGKAIYDYGHTLTNVQCLKEGPDKGKVQVNFNDRTGAANTTLADLVIGADGPSSKVRQIFAPDVERKYAGYVAWRGTVSESEASAETRAAFGETLTYFQTEGSHILL